MGFTVANLIDLDKKVTNFNMGDGFVSRASGNTLSVYKTEGNNVSLCNSEKKHIATFTREQMSEALELGIYKVAGKGDDGKKDMKDDTTDKVDKTEKAIMEKAKISSMFMASISDKNRVGEFLLRLSDADETLFEKEEEKKEFEALKENIASVGKRIAERVDVSKEKLFEIQSIYDFVNSSLYASMAKNVKSAAITKDVRWERFKTATSWIQSIFSDVLKGV